MPPDEAALGELLATSHAYDQSASTVVPYDPQSVSWPSIDSPPVPLGKGLSHEDRAWLEEWPSHMLSSAGTAGDPLQLYMDPRLSGDRAAYAKFLGELASRHMIVFGLSSDVGPSNTGCRLLLRQEKVGGPASHL